MAFREQAKTFVGTCGLCSRGIIRGQWYMLEFESRRYVHTKCRSVFLKALKENNDIDLE